VTSVITVPPQISMSSLVSFCRLSEILSMKLREESLLLPSSNILTRLAKPELTAFFGLSIPSIESSQDDKEFLLGLALCELPELACS
jgi:hypothetical protein